MPNIASVLKAEISRIARKESRADSDALKKTVASQRSDLVALKRRVQELEKALKAVAKGVASGRPARAGAASAGSDEVDAGGFRFRASGMASNRKRLGLSAEDFGLLIGASGQSVYLWESGKTKPRSKNLAAIAALRGIGKREVARRLEALKQ
jgi:DNA-binding transcriptional regulator YiaG